MIGRIFKRCMFLLFAFFGAIICHPELSFALFITPTNFAKLNKYLSIPEYLNIKTILLLYISAFITIIIIKNKKVPSIPIRLIFVYLVFTIFMIWSLFWTTDFEYGLSKSIDFVFLTTLACFAPFFLFRNERAFDRFIMSLVVMSVFLSIFVFVAMPYSLIDNEMKHVKFETVLGGNYLLIQHVTGMASLGIIYHILNKDLTGGKKVIYSMLSILFIATLLYSAGKSSIISFFLTVMFMFAISMKRKGTMLSVKRKNFKIGLYVIIIGAMFALTIGWVFLIRVKALSLPDYYGRVERISNAKIALDLFLENPFRGVGIGGFHSYSVQIEDLEKFKYPHNIILETMSELGLYGLVLFLLILRSSFKKLIFLKNKYWNYRFSTLPNVVISLMVFTFLTSLTSGNITNFALFAFVGTAYAIENIIRKEIEETGCVSG